MNTRIQNQISNMKTQTIGVEIEMNSITRKKAAEHGGTPSIFAYYDNDRRNRSGMYF